MEGAKISPHCIPSPAAEKPGVPSLIDEARRYRALRDLTPNLRGVRPVVVLVNDRHEPAFIDIRHSVRYGQQLDATLDNIISKSGTDSAAVPSSSASLSDVDLLAQQRDELLQALEDLYEHEGTVDYTGIGEMRSERLTQALFKAAEVIATVKAAKAQAAPCNAPAPAGTGTAER